MIIHNITFKLPHYLLQDFYTWLKEQHLKDYLQTELFSAYSIAQLQDFDENDQGITLIVQLKCDNKNDFELYLERHEEKLRAKLMRKFGNEIIGFRTTMEQLYEQQYK